MIQLASNPELGCKIKLVSLFDHDQSHPLSGGLRETTPFSDCDTPRNRQNNDPSKVYTFFSIELVACYELILGLDAAPWGEPLASGKRARDSDASSLAAACQHRPGEGDAAKPGIELARAGKPWGRWPWVKGLVSPPVNPSEPGKWGTCPKR